MLIANLEEMSFPFILCLFIRSVHVLCFFLARIYVKKYSCIMHNTRDIFGGCGVVIVISWHHSDALQW